MCFDAKINFDDNAEFRQTEIFSMEEVTEEKDPREVEASKHNLNYIGMDGNIGCLGEKISAVSVGILKCHQHVVASVIFVSTQNMDMNFNTNRFCSKWCWSCYGYNGHCETIQR